MPNQPLNPDESARKAAMDCWINGGNIDDVAECAVESFLAVAQPVVSTVEELVTTRTGLALANQAFKEGLSAGIRACNASGPDKPFTKPESPYSAPLLAMIKADRPEADDA